MVVSLLALGACTSSVTESSPAAGLNTTVASATDEATATVATTVAPIGTDAATTTASNTATTATVETIAATSPAAATSSTVGLTTDRPYEVFVPSSYDAARALPLVILLHGYTASGAIQEAYFQLQPLAEQRGFLYVHPDGLKDRAGNQFWNATDACCDFARPDVDDSAYLSAIIDQIEAKYSVDPKRIFFVGHSNGGFMSYRMACDHADRIAAIASLAGETFADAAACIPSEPVSVLQIQGTADKTINYQGGSIIGHDYPGSKATVATWAGYDGCATTSTDAPTKLDLEAKIVGDETTVSAFAGCRNSSAVELWTIDGAGHIPALAPTFSAMVIDFLFAHPKP